MIQPLDIPVYPQEKAVRVEAPYGLSDCNLSFILPSVIEYGFDESCGLQIEGCFPLTAAFSWGLRIYQYFLRGVRWNQTVISDDLAPFPGETGLHPNCPPFVLYIDFFDPNNASWQSCGVESIDVLGVEDNSSVYLPGSHNIYFPNPLYSNPDFQWYINNGTLSGKDFAWRTFQTLTIQVELYSCAPRPFGKGNPSVFASLAILGKLLEYGE